MTRAAQGDPIDTASKMEMIPDPSEEFLDAFSGGSAGIIVECDFCGRVYFSTSDHGDYEEGELESLRANAEKEPDGCIEVDYFTSRVEVDGKTYAYGCKCNKVRRYEDFIWLHRREILAYIKARMEKRLKAAKEDMEIARGALTAAKLSEDEAEGERELLRKLLKKYPDESRVHHYIMGERTDIAGRTLGEKTP